MPEYNRRNAGIPALGFSPDILTPNSDFAKTLNPSLILDYIPMAERWNCRWLATHTLQCPKWGNLYWVGKGPRPESDKAMQATKLFVIEEWVGSEVEHLVKEVQKVKKMSWYKDYTQTKEQNNRLIKKSLNQLSTPHLIKRLEEWENQGKSKAVPKWVENSMEWWFRLSDIDRDVVLETVCQKNTEFLLRLRQNSGMPEQETEQESVWGASFRPRNRLFWHPAGIRQFLRLAAAKQLSKPTATQI
ncbi:hypothetical protein RhiLY_05347 [Ceratobasidium sp. AG-Ba]|nr:hypothetical protein RhiLY_05347 [Ceratobasidium sp. AG-Ba]